MPALIQQPDTESLPGKSNVNGITGCGVWIVSIKHLVRLLESKDEVNWVTQVTPIRDLK